MNDRFVTRDAGLARFLLHQKVGKLTVLTDDRYRPVFTFPVPEANLREHFHAYANATVNAADFERADRLLRKLIKEARYRRSANERVLASGGDVKTRWQPVDYRVEEVVAAVMSALAASPSVDAGGQ